ncbi:MAG: hypothetical protein O4861_10355 [Trichodesmium sp. St16_bin4-tuft]|nr:hypothetical protein [Trichodesmium sp. St2_bin6]MDE5098709.1 hypothetical protein [Trichodesmium sp. St16_bin4-tuft]
MNASLFDLHRQTLVNSVSGKLKSEKLTSLITFEWVGSPFREE